jgi:hypothetical protein
MQWPSKPAEASPESVDVALKLLEEIKDQLDRLEESLYQERETTHEAITELKSHLESIPVGPKPEEEKTVVIPEDSQSNNLFGLLPLLENPENLLSSPLAKLLPLLSNDKFLHLFEIIQKMQKGELPRPSEVLPLAQMFYDQKAMIQQNQAFANWQPMQEKLSFAKRQMETLIEQLESINTEATALVEIVGLMSLKKQRVP